jgi:hypothetical protein
MELYFTYRGIYICSIYRKHKPDPELDCNLPIVKIYNSNSIVGFDCYKVWN